MQDNQRNATRIRHLNTSLQSHMTLYGYEIFETPLIEAADLFLAKAGDQIIEKLFTFERHGQQFALRPEFTAAAAYRYLTSQTQDTVRWQFSGSVFEDYDAQRDIEHFSIGAELIGATGAIADAEIIAMAAHALIAQGINDFQIVIGHAGLTRRLLDRFQLDARTRRFMLNHREDLKKAKDGKRQILAQLNQHTNGHRDTAGFANDEKTHTNTQQMLGILLDATRRAETMGGRTRQDIAGRLLQKHQQLTEQDQTEAALDFLSAWVVIQGKPETVFSQVQAFITPNDVESEKMLAQWQEILPLLHAYGIPVESIIIQPDLARMWDYYTGIVFELQVDGKQIGGGGRYDELARLLGGKQDIPAVGFAYYVDTLLDILPSTEIPTPKSILIQTSTENQPLAIQWAQRLRQNNFPVTLTIGDSPSVEEFTLFIDAHGDLHFSGQSYQPNQFNALIEHLNGTLNHDR